MTRYSLSPLIVRSAVLVLIGTGLLAAQEKAQTGQPAAEPPKTDEATAEQPASADAAEAAAGDQAVNVSMEVGYRWVGSIKGNGDVYRSVVNLGEGPRLLNLDLSMSPSSKWIDSLTLSANSWGGDPYNTAMVKVAKTGAYRLDLDYRNIAYFNALPSFANPNLERGVLRSQRTFDMTRRYTDVLFEARPGKRIVPFFGYTHDAGFGRGVTLYVPALNEYPVATYMDDRTDTYRGGVRLEAKRAHLTLEQGAFSFSNDDRVFTADRNLGNRATPFVGQTLFLQNLAQNYTIDGDSIFTRAYATGNPTDWLDLYGNFVFTQPKNTTTFSEQATGLFATSNPIAFFPTQALVFDAIAKQPHIRGSFGFELRPLSRVRIIHSWMTDRLHTATSGSQGVTDRLEMNYSHNQIEALVEATDKLTLRGGHRYSYGDSRVRAGNLSATGPIEAEELRRHTALGGISYRWGQKLFATLDAEIASGDAAYFRTSLLDYQRLRGRVRYQALTSLGITYSSAFLNNDNQQARTTLVDDFDATTVDNSIGFFWSPNDGKRVRVLGEYARQNWRANTLYLEPQDLTPARSLYRENGHSATLLVDVSPPIGGTWSPRISVGGNLYKSTGTRPTEFYTPTIRIAAPIVKHMDWNAEWRWWGMSEPLYSFENFRNHQLTFSIRVY